MNDEISQEQQQLEKQNLHLGTCYITLLKHPPLQVICLVLL